jgi:hypothetical protein
LPDPEKKSKVGDVITHSRNCDPFQASFGKAGFEGELGRKPVTRGIQPTRGRIFPVVQKTYLEKWKIVFVPTQSTPTPVRNRPHVRPLGRRLLSSRIAVLCFARDDVVATSGRASGEPEHRCASSSSPSSYISPPSISPTSSPPYSCFLARVRQPEAAAVAATTAPSLASIRLLQMINPLLPSPSSFLAMLDLLARFAIHRLMRLLLLPSVLAVP